VVEAAVEAKQEPAVLIGHQASARLRVVIMVVEVLQIIIVAQVLAVTAVQEQFVLFGEQKELSHQLTLLMFSNINIINRSTGTKNVNLKSS
jgi:hypothetical protein